MNEQPLSLFSAWGIELEYMIVDRATLDVRAIADRLLREAAGSDVWVEDVEAGPIGWSNELVSHVVELKCAQPVPTLAGLAAQFQSGIGDANKLLAGHQACLMPSAMHPWMRPAEETRIWPHESGAIYRAYDKLFDCRRHGWANLQSMHVNLPFADADEFARLMAAIRLVVPLIPALAASSPIVEQRSTRRLDNRLFHYRGNASLVPAMAGDVVPEAVFDVDEYRDKVLAPISRQLRDVGAGPELLARDWLNARGAIARFDRMAIEIRVTDTQENPRADLAIAAAIGTVVRMLVEERSSSLRRQRGVPSQSLVRLLGRTTRKGPDAPLRDPDFASLFGVASGQAETAGQLWREVLARGFDGPAELEQPIDVIFAQGTLAQRLLFAIGADIGRTEFERAELEPTYRRLCACLAEGSSFEL